MTTLDIRQSEEDIYQIAFDSSSTRIHKDEKELYIIDNDGDSALCCKWEDLDNFILAIRKARELWYKETE